MPSILEVRVTVKSSSKAFWLSVPTRPPRPRAGVMKSARPRVVRRERRRSASKLQGLQDLRRRLDPCICFASELASVADRFFSFNPDRVPSVRLKPVGTRLLVRQVLT